MIVDLVGQKVTAAVDAFDPFGEVYGVGRSILALGTAIMIAYAPLDELRFVGVVALLVVASGFRPRFTGFLHAGVAFVLQINHVEGGRIASLLALLLLPITVLDDRSWHWSSPKARSLDARERTRRLVARACFLLLRVQIAVFYLQASLTEAQLAAPEWGVLIGECILGAGIILSPRYRNLLLAFGVTLHTGLAIAHGQWPLAIFMNGALVLFLRPLDQPFSTMLRAGKGPRMSLI